jgi:3-deoxy-7-phosphoheptulonate synthase
VSIGRCGRTVRRPHDGDDALQHFGVVHGKIPIAALHPVNLPADWAPDSWRARPATQMPVYPCPPALQEALRELRALPPLVTLEIIRAQAAPGRSAGRQALPAAGRRLRESFAECESGLISNRLKVLLQMSLVLVHGLRLPVVRVGRFAGQYAKPRSTETETRGELRCRATRRHRQRPEFTSSAPPDPRRMVKAMRARR